MSSSLSGYYSKIGVMKRIRGHIKLNGTEQRRYDALRLKILDKAGWRCSQCKQAGKLELHHIKPTSQGGSFWDIKNIKVLCRLCHIAHHRSEQERQVKEWQEFIKRPGYNPF